MQLLSIKAGIEPADYLRPQLLALSRGLCKCRVHQQEKQSGTRHLLKQPEQLGASKLYPPEVHWVVGVITRQKFGSDSTVAWCSHPMSLASVMSF